MVWSAISAAGTGDLVKIDGIMDKKVYHNILVRHGVPSGSRLIVGRDLGGQSMHPIIVGTTVFASEGSL